MTKLAQKVLEDYRNEGTMPRPQSAETTKALAQAVIDQAKEIEWLKMSLKRELKGRCVYCVHANKEVSESPCDQCHRTDYRPKWEFDEESIEEV